MAVLDVEKSAVAYTGFFNYDSSFPAYGTMGGVLPAADPSLRHTSPLMLLDALDLAFTVLRRDGVPLEKIGVLKADCMQHCTVYVDNSFGTRAGRLSSGKTLAEQIGPSLTRQSSPIWEDRTTQEEAAFLEQALAERGGCAAVTGNRAELRFPAAQLMKWGKENPHAFEATGRVFLLSAFVTSLLAGTDAPVDTGDGWGTNLNSLDILRPGWSAEAAAAADCYLRSHGVSGSVVDALGCMVAYDETVGTMSGYFVDKYGVNGNAVVLAGTGDNPATLLGCGEAVISLGSSFTVNGAMDRVMPSKNGEYNVFGFTGGRAMALSVITNGSKLHEIFLRRYLRLPVGGNIGQEQWDRYLAMAGPRTLSPDERLMLPYEFDESIPVRRRGVFREGFSESDCEASIRALHLSQVLSLRLHSGHLGSVRAICLAGGGARNPLMRGMIADAFGARAYSLEHAAFAAPLGCAVSGARHLLGCGYDEVVERFLRIDGGSAMEPDSRNAGRMALLCARYGDLERHYHTGVE
ncbi:MAG: hypothetical protein JXA20_03960 [Spirochaetes bacterium]|nr:hypothetical protein [Spirochaetota bacterium]